MVFRHPQAACRGLDPAVFFPDRGQIDASRYARSVCARCPVCEPCLTHALRYPTLIGIWGGTNERQRQRMRRQTELCVDDVVA